MRCYLFILFYIGSIRSEEETLILIVNSFTQVNDMEEAPLAHFKHKASTLG